jgi:signal transduction histidine kinase
MSVSAELLAEFRAVEELGDLSDEDLEWFVSQCTIREYARGDAVFRKGDAAETMLVVLAGEFRALRDEQDSDGQAFVRGAGDLGGMLPYSRLRNYPATGKATTDTRIAHFPASRFDDLLERIPALEPRLVTAMTDRVRESTRMDNQRDKLVSLGKLSAGLAHELNNPAAAARRSAAELRPTLRDLTDRTCRLARQTDETVMQRLLELRQELDPMSCARLDPVARSDREEELAEWLDERGVEGAWEYAPSLVSAGATTQWLEHFAAELPDDARDAGFGWVEASVRADEMVLSLEHAAQRISDLVGEVKQYTHMDQASVQEVDVHAGLESTLQLLAHKLQGIEVTRDYAADLPRIRGSGAELNQVWTNLIDNAADAAEAGGSVRLRTFVENDALCVEVGDSGPGVPAEDQERIFDPFVTTKDVGRGSGLGLDIARRIVEQHRGSIRLFSEPGNTRFVVRLPMGGNQPGSQPDDDAGA